MTPATTEVEPVSDDAVSSTAGKPRSTRDLGRVAALVLMAASTMLVTLLPVAGREVTYRWVPPESFGLGKVQLLMPATPDSLTATWPCSATRAYAPPPGAPPKRFFSTGSSTNGEMTAWMDAGSVSVFLAGRPVIGATLPLTSDDCEITLRYQDASRSVTLTDGRQNKTVPLKTSVVRDTDAIDAVQVTGLDVARELRTATNVEVVARPSTQVWTLARWTIAAGGLAAALYLWWSFFRTSRPGPKGRPPAKWTMTDTAVSVSAVFALFVIPPLADDGWVLTTVRAFPQLGFFSNYFTANAAAQPEGFWWTSIERIWMSPLGTSILALRIPSMVIGILAWWYLRRGVLDQVTEVRSQRWVRAVAATVYVSVMWAWMPTLRPEPMIGLLSAVALALVLRFRGRTDGWVLLTMAGVAALAFSAHQTGWIVIGVSCAALPDVRRWWRTDPQAARSTVLASVAVFMCSVLLLMMLKSNLNILFEARGSFIEGGRHNAILDESIRVRGLIDSAATAPVRLWSAMLVPVGAMLWLFLVWRGWERGPARLTAGAAALGGIFLALTSSKWQWHFGATIAIAACAFALLAQRSLRSRSTTVVFAIVVALLGFLATSRPSGWGLQDLRLVNVDESTLGLGVRLVAFGLVAGVSVWLISRSGPARGVMMAVFGCAAIVSATSVVPILVDGVRDPVTSWPALVARSAAPGDCGLASEMRVATVTAPLAKAGGQFTPDSLTESAWGSDLTLPMPPVPAVSMLRPTGAFPIPLSTPWYLVDKAHPMQTWIYSDRPGFVGYTVEWRSEDGTTSTVARGRFIEGPSWILVPLSAPADAAQVRLTWRNSPVVGTVLSPVAVTGSAPVADLVAGPVLRTPASALYAPCFPQPDISSGAISPFMWSLGLPMLGQSKAATGVGVFSEQACIDNPTSEVYAPLCWYSQTIPSSEGLTTTSRLVKR